MSAQYEIVRFFGPARGKPAEVRETGLTLEEAQAHCSLESTHGDGWFDGYREMGDRPRLKPEGITNMMAGITGDYHRYNHYQGYGQ